MNNDIQRNLGEQPLARIMADRGLSRSDLVSISSQHITHKMVARACKGRRLTAHSQHLILNALNQAAETTYSLSDLFTYATQTSLESPHRDGGDHGPDDGAGVA